MSQLPKTILIALLVSPATILSGPANAQGTGSAAPMSITEQAAEASKRIDEYRELFKSPDLRASALQLAMKDANPVVRGMALTEGLRPFQTLAPEFVLPPSGIVSAGDVPSLVIGQIKWAADGKSFTAVYSTLGCSSSVVTGQVSGGKVSISYPYLCLKPDWAIIKPGVNSNFAQAACQVIMAPSSEGDYLEGPLRCTGISKVLNVRLPFGA